MLLNILNHYLPMEQLLEETFLTNLNKSIILEFGKKELVKIIMGHDSFTQEAKYLAIKKIFTLVSDQEIVQIKNQRSFEMKDILEKVFLKHVENVTTKIQELIIMVIKHDQFTLDFKRIVLEKLFQKISDVNFGNSTKDNPLMILCWTYYLFGTERLELIKFLVEKIKVNINKLSFDKVTAIIYAYQGNLTDVVEYLISMGAILEYDQIDGNIVSIFNYGDKLNKMNLLKILIKYHSKKINNVVN